MRIHLDSEYTYLPEIGKILVNISVTSIYGDDLMWVVALVWEDIEYANIATDKLSQEIYDFLLVGAGIEEWDNQISEEWTFPKHTYLGLFHTLRERLLKKNA